MNAAAPQPAPQAPQPRSRNDSPHSTTHDAETGLPLAVREVAQRAGLVSVYDLSQRYGVPTRNFKSGLAREGAPAPKALSFEYHYGRRSPLYSLREFQNWHDGLPGERPLGLKRTSRKVRLVGTKTPTAGRPYVWRDARRWSPDA